MSMTRTMIEGPAVIEYNGATYYTTDAIQLSADLAMHELVSSYFGPIDRRVTDKAFNLTFTPVGMLSIAADKYYPYSWGDIGKAVMAAPDKAVVIWTSAGQKITFPAGCVSACPQLNLGVGLAPMGQMSIACLGDLAKTDAATEAHYKIETAALAAHSLDPSVITTPGYVCELGGDTTLSIDAEEGFTFELGINLEPRKVNAYGTVNYKLTAMAPKITFAPAGKTETEMLTLLNIQGAGAARLGQSNRLGRKLTLKPRNAADLGITIEFTDCQLIDLAMQFGTDTPRHGTYAFVPVLTASEGVMVQPYTITFPTFPSE